MYSTLAGSIVYFTGILIFLSIAWHILLRGKRCRDNTFLFFALLATQFLALCPGISFFPFTSLFFFTLFLFFQNIWSIFIYSFPRSNKLSLLWTAILITSSILAFFIFRAITQYFWLPYLIISFLYGIYNTLFIIRKRKYLLVVMRKDTTVSLFVVATYTLLVGLVISFTTLTYNIGIIKYGFLTIFPAALFIIVLLLLYRVPHTPHLTPKVIFFLILIALPCGAFIFILAPFRATFFSYIPSLYFLASATFLSFIFLNFMAQLIVSAVIFFRHYLSDTGDEHQKIISDYRMMTENITDHRELLRFFDRTVRNSFREINTLQYIFFEKKAFFPDVEETRQDRIYDPSLRRGSLARWIEKRREPFILRKKSLLPPEVHTEMYKLKADLLVPVFSEKKLLGLITVNGKHLSSGLGHTLASLISLTDDAGTRISLFAEILNGEKRLQELRHFQETDKMVSFIAHELRTPLTSIMFNLDIITDTLDTSGQIDREYLDIARKELRRLNDTIEKMLAFGRDIILHPEPGKFSDFIEEIKYFFISAPFTVIFINHTDKTYQLDWDYLKQLFLNLISNSIQAMSSTGKGSSVEVTISEIPLSLLILIKDNGPGITPEAIPSIFEPFYTTRKEGNGLGLAICDKIVRHMGGSILLEDTSPQGTVFSVTLPLPF